MINEIYEFVDYDNDELKHKSKDLRFESLDNLHIINAVPTIYGESKIPSHYILTNVDNILFRNIRDVSELSEKNYTDEQVELCKRIIYLLERSIYSKLQHRYNDDFVAPTAYIEKDEDGACCINFVNEYYRLYFNVERDIQNSFYGISMNVDGSMYLTSGRLIEQKLNSIINKFVAIILGLSI